MAAVREGTDQEARRPLPQEAILEALRLTEAAVATARKAIDGALVRVQLRLHAWRTARDPETPEWLEHARRAVKDGSAAERASTRQEILAAIDKSAPQH